MTVRVAAISDVGTVRDENQDVVVVGSLTSTGTMRRSVTIGLADSGMVAVVDGMGGHVGGRIAAEIVAKELAAEGDEDLGRDRLEALLDRANIRLYERMGREPVLRGMGATLAGVAWVGEAVVVFHVGDSRVYARSTGELRRLTNDHRISEETNVLSRSLGGATTVQSVEADFAEFELDGPVRFLCCTDGLSDVVDFATIDRHLAAEESTDCVDDLLAAAIAAGADDNVSLVVADLTPAQVDESGATNDGGSNNRVDESNRLERRRWPGWLKGQER